jgi:hypothetical protein
MKKNALPGLQHQRCCGITAFTIIIAFVLASCNPATPVPTNEINSSIVKKMTDTRTPLPTNTIVQPSHTLSSTTRPTTKNPQPTPRRKPRLFITRTPFRWKTPTPTATPTALISLTPFPTFDVKQVITYTPFPTGECPVEDQYHVFEMDLPENEIVFNMDEIILQALEEGASFAQVVKKVDAVYPYNGLSIRDLTGDGTPELVVPILYHTAVLTCNHGKYEKILDYQSSGGAIGNAYFKNVLDMNMNGVPEVIVNFTVSTGWNTTVDILEWDGEQFQSLILADLGEDSISTSRQARGLYWYETEWVDNFYEDDYEPYRPSMNGPAHYYIYDTDNNGTRELVLTDSGLGNMDTMTHYGPWRGKSVIFKWDGLHFIYSSLEMKPAQYRFQAVQDADRLFLLGDYDHALDLYRNVIYKKNLDWWSSEKMDILADAFYARLAADPTPTPLAPENNDEYVKLSAYARYRIVLHHLTRGWISDAEAAYQSMLKIYLEDSPGYAYVEMATILWNAFQESNDLELACQPVTDHARSHPEILAPLGDKEHGNQSHWYEPEDVCPFGQTFK